MCRTLIGDPFDGAKLGVPSNQKGCKIIYATLSFFMVLSSNKWYFKCYFTECRSYWDHNSPAPPGAIRLAQSAAPVRNPFWGQAGEETGCPHVAKGQSLAFWPHSLGDWENKEELFERLTPAEVLTCLKGKGKQKARKVGALSEY